MSDPRELLLREAQELGIVLAADAVQKLLLLMRELQVWNRRINLTSIDDEEGIVVKHLLDSLTLLPFLPGECRLLDIGSGGGFPGLPLKIVRPSLSVVSVDSVQKKISFQKHVTRLLELDGFLPLHARAEDLPRNYAGSFDVVVSRAFSDIPKFASLSLPLLKENGTILAMKGKEGKREAEEAVHELERLGLVVREVAEFALPISGDGRSVVVIGKS